MKREPWAITSWGKTGDLKQTIAYTLDNRPVPEKARLNAYIASYAPLIVMRVTVRFTAPELKEYLTIIRDRLNVEEVVEELTKP